MEEMTFSELLDALAELRGRLVSILVTGRHGEPEPIAVLIGTAGVIDMAGEDEGDVSRAVAFVPVEEETAPGMGRQGVYLKVEDYHGVSRIADRLVVTMRDVTLEIEPM